MNKVYFIAPYVSEIAGRNVSCTPSSITYSKYLISAFTRLSNRKAVVLLSLCSSKEKAYFSKKSVEYESHSEVYFRSLSPSWGKLAKRITQIWLYLQIFCYLHSHTKKEDIVVVYHDFGLSFFYRIFRKFIHCKLVYLVGEVYNAVYDRGDKAIEKECKRLSNADAYIYANDIMPRLFNNQKPFAVCYGNYSYSERPKLIDKKIHVLFAGKISTGIINDAFVALDVIKYLPEGYVMHMAGYGDIDDVEELKDRITKLNEEIGYSRVTYEGNLSGKAYEDLLSKCQVGLCTRTLRNELSNYCFPSKTLVYLTHDIIPICPQIDNLMASSVSSRLAFVNGDLSPKNIATTIVEQNSCLVGYNNKTLIELLDRDLIKNLNNILN